MLVLRWSTVYDVGPTSNQHWFNVLCLLDNVIKCAESDTWWQSQNTGLVMCLLGYHIILMSTDDVIDVSANGPFNSSQFLILASPMFYERHEWKNMHISSFENSVRPFSSKNDPIFFWHQTIHSSNKTIIRCKNMQFSFSYGHFFNQFKLVTASAMPTLVILY